MAASKTVENRSECTILWRIENVSFYWQKKGEFLESPIFIVDMEGETRWKLVLYPSGCLNENFVDVYLKRDEGGSSIDKIEIGDEMSFLSSDLLISKSRSSEKATYKKGDCLGWSDFMKREDLFIKERESFLPQDVLTVRCRMWKVEGKSLENTQIFARSVIKVTKTSFTWSIQEFSSLKGDQKIPLIIKSASKQVMATLNLSLATQCDKEMICVEVIFPNKSLKLFRIRSCIMDERQREIGGTRQEHRFNDFSTSGKYNLLQTKRKLAENAALYLPNDVLSLRFECAVSPGIVLEEIERIDVGLDVFSENHRTPNKPKESLFTLKDDLKAMYDEGILTDMKLRTATDTFPVHKCILGARSPVFKSMFSTDMKERHNESVDIADVESEILSRLLKYIYMDSLDGLEVKTATQLFEAADKYSILSLKAKCSAFLKDNLDPSNACDILVVADMHTDEDLKLTVQDYILEHECVFRSQDWKHLMEENPKLTSETMFRKYSKM